MSSFAGSLFLALALIQCLLLVILGFLAPSERRQKTLGILNVGHSLSLLLAMALLIFSMVQLDYSLAYTGKNASNHLPVIYRITASWGGHEGSLLLWTTLIAFWGMLFWLTSRHLPDRWRNRTTAIIGVVSLGFHILLILSPPFAAVVGDIPTDGQGLNPMLQDIALTIHPPTLYIGYGGATLLFAQALAAIWLKVPVSQWLPVVRKTSLLAWGWLTLGIALGSWWAYRELGWGGWWFWDPVENSSLMPWLTLTALLHVPLLTTRNGVIATVTTALAITTLGLVLVGMFIVRSGILTSVHAFSVSPALGLFILGFVLLVTGGGWLILAFFPPVSDQRQALLSNRDITLVAGILVLVIAASVVLLGTLYPLVMDVLGYGRISVGAPYFNMFFVPLSLAAGALVGLLSLRGGIAEKVLVLVLAVVMACYFSARTGGSLDPGAITALTIALLIGYGSLQKIASGRISHGTLAHFGLALAIAGATVSDLGVTVKETRVWPMEAVTVADHSFRFTGTSPVMGPNYLSDYGFFEITTPSGDMIVLNPEKRLYPYFGQVMTEVDIDSHWEQDIYLALGEAFEDGSWAVRIKLIPFISLLWGGALLMVFGGFFCFSSPRRAGAVHSDKQKLQQGKTHA